MGKPIFDRASLLAYGIILAWSACAIRISTANPTIGLSDMFGFIERAEALRFSSLTEWVDGFYPLGYPLLLKAIYLVTGDYVVAGRTIAFGFGLVGLLTIYGISLTVFSRGVGVLALVFCGTSPTYLRYATVSGTDMPSAVMLLLGTSLLCLSSQKQSSRYLVASGLAFGTAYLIRYSALPAVLAAAVWMLLKGGSSYLWRQRLRESALFALAFLAACGPQLLVSLVAQGNPFYNLQYQNVYFGILGEGNWGLQMSDARSQTGLGEILLEQPRLFFKNWYHNLVDSLRLDLVQFPLQFFSYVSILYSLKHQRLRSYGLLFLLLFCAFTAAIALAFLRERLLLFSTLILITSAAFGVLAIIPREIRVARATDLPVRRVVLALLIPFLLWTYLRPALTSPVSEYDRTKIDVSGVLASERMERAHDVLSFSFDYYDLQSPTKDRFAMPWYEEGFRPYASIADIAERMREAGQRYFVFDFRAPNNVRGLRDIWPFGDGELARDFRRVASVEAGVHIYAVKDHAVENGETPD
jgi:hypothetical protein